MARESAMEEEGSHNYFMDGQDYFFVNVFSLNCGFNMQILE